MTLLPRDRQLMDALSRNEIMDHSMVNAIRVSTRVMSLTEDELSFIYNLC